MESVVDSVNLGTATYELGCVKVYWGELYAANSRQTTQEGKQTTQEGTSRRFVYVQSWKILD